MLLFHPIEDLALYRVLHYVHQLMLLESKQAQSVLSLNIVTKRHSELHVFLSFVLDVPTETVNDSSL